MSNFTPAPLPFPYDSSKKNWAAQGYTKDQLLQDLTVASQNVKNGPQTGVGADGPMYTQLHEVQSGLLYACRGAGATQTEIQAAQGK